MPTRRERIQRTRQRFEDATTRGQQRRARQRLRRLGARNLPEFTIGRGETVEGGTGGDATEPTSPIAGTEGQFQGVDTTAVTENIDTSSPQGIAQGQMDLNQQTAQIEDLINRANQENIFGSRELSYDPETGRLRISDQLSPEQQRRYDAQSARERAIESAAQRGITGLGAQIGTPLDTSGLNPLTQDFSADRRQIEDRLMRDFDRRWQPEFEREREQLEQSLANRGIPRGSARAREELANLQQRQTDARTNAMSSASNLAGQEQQNMWNRNLAARQQGYGEMLTGRKLPFDELGGLLGLGAGVSAPNFGPVGSVGMTPTDITNPALEANRLRAEIEQGALDRASAERRQRMSSGATTQAAGTGAFNRYQIALLEDQRARDLAADRNALTAATANLGGTGSSGGGSNWGNIVGNFTGNAARGAFAG